MSQYFAIVNEDKQEYIISEYSASNALATLTDPIGTGMLAYLLLEGPQDGTRFTENVNPYAPEHQEAISEFMAEERENYRNTGMSSPYRNDDGSRDKPKIMQSIAAGWDIDEANEYAGRWNGDTVRVVGDYADSGLYDDATDVQWVYETDDGDRFTTYATAMSPIAEAEISSHKVNATIEDRETVPGDECIVRHPDTGEQVRAELKEIKDRDWVDITKQVEREFTQFVGQDWVEAHEDDSRLRADAVISFDEDGNASIATGDDTVKPIETDGGRDVGRRTTLDEF